MVLIAATCTVLAAANYYLHLGWFGEHGKLVLFTLAFLTLISIRVRFSYWKDKSNDSAKGGQH